MTADEIQVVNATVLAIDDAREVHALLAARLRPEGVSLLAALGWEEGLSLAVNSSPDLILLDVDMPERSGLDLCRMLKADPRTASIPVIFLTGSTDIETKVHGFDLGAVDYITKPFHPAELRARVRAALRTKRYQDLLTARAQVDALTGLHNRTYFDTFLDSAVRSSVREGEPLSLILLDLDHFKRLNDECGHPFGDLVLQRTGEIVGHTLRHNDAACRYGGEEIGIILPGLTSTNAMKVAERVRAAIANLSLVNPRGEPLTVTASFGVAELHELRRLGTARDSLISAADLALYDAKRLGRNRSCLAPPERIAA